MASTAQVKYFLQEQQAATLEGLADPTNRTLVGVALIGGLVSSLALQRLSSRITPGTDDDGLRGMAIAGLIAMGTGTASVLWNLYRARKVIA